MCYVVAYWNMIPSGNDDRGNFPVSLATVFGILPGVVIMDQEYLSLFWSLCGEINNNNTGIDVYRCCNGYLNSEHGTTAPYLSFVSFYFNAMFRQLPDLQRSMTAHPAQRFLCLG